MRGLWLAGGALYFFRYSPKGNIFWEFISLGAFSLALLRPFLAIRSLVRLGLASGGGFASEAGQKIRDGGEGEGRPFFCEEKRVHVSEISPAGGAVVFMSDDGRRRDGRDVRLGGLCRSRGCRSKGSCGWWLEPAGALIGRRRADAPPGLAVLLLGPQCGVTDSRVKKKNCRRDGKTDEREAGGVAVRLLW